MLKEETINKHSSYGLIMFTRCSGSNRTLFGSSIGHSETISLRVSEASIERSDSRDWYHGEEPIVEVEMSQIQFAEAITSMGQMPGVPVTIRRKGEKLIESCKFINKRVQHQKEFEDRMGKFAKRVDALTLNSNKILSGNKAPSKKEKREILEEIRMLRQEIKSNIPFFQKRFEEEMDKTVIECKGEVEAFVQNKITTLGLKELSKLKMIEE